MSVNATVTWYPAETNMCTLVTQWPEQVHDMANKRVLGVFTLNCLQTGHWVRVDYYIMMDWAHVFVIVQVWFSVALWMNVRKTSDPPQGLSHSTPRSPKETPANQDSVDGNHDVIRDTLQCSGFPEHITTIILQSWRSGTHGQYQTYHQRLLQGKNPMQPSVNRILEFLYQQYSLGIGCSALNRTRWALSSFISINIVPVGQIPLFVALWRVSSMNGLHYPNMMSLRMLIVSCIIWNHYLLWTLFLWNCSLTNLPCCWSDCQGSVDKQCTCWMSATWRSVRVMQNLPLVTKLKWDPAVM